MKLATKVDVRKNLTTLYEIANESAEFISDMRTAFIYNKSKPLEGYKSMIKENSEKAEHITAIIREAARDNEEMKSYVNVPRDISKIWLNLDRLYDLTEKKVTENVLFSDKAVNETIYLLQRLIEILKPSADIILARNKFLSTYIEESQKSLEKNATAYATFHENRLITGECMPNASSIYVSMLEAIKSVAWHTKEIAVALG